MVRRRCGCQICPSSLQDTDGNGIGNLTGIIFHLDCIKSLGVSAIWLNPIFVPEWTGSGYDVIGFCKFVPRFGTNTDVVTLVKEARALLVNQSSM